jgi:hypothetical protein
MSHEPVCNCQGCRAREVSAGYASASADLTAATARLSALLATRAATEAEGDLAIATVRRVNKHMRSCTAALHAAMDQFDAAKARCE